MKTKLFYGWIIVGVAFISMAFWMGIRASFSVFYSHLVEVFPWGRGEAAVAQSITFVMYMVFVPIIGTLIDRFDPRKVTVLGVTICGIGLILCAFIKNLWTMYIYYGVITGTGICFISIVTYSAILSRWFERKRGLASGIATSGMGVGTFVLVVLTERMIQLFGWREAFVILGIITLGLLLPTNGLLLRSKPQEMGLEVDGLFHSSFNGRINMINYRFWDALRTNKFWFLVCFASFALMGIQIILVHNVRFLVDRGIDIKIASLAFAVVGIISSIFRIVWGWLSDKIGRELSYSIGAICLALSALWLIFVHPENDLSLCLFVLFFGIGWGATAPSFMAVAADLFKGEQFGAIYGFFESAMYLLSIIGVWIAGYIFDKFGTYTPSFLLVIGSSLISILFLWITAPRKFRKL